MFFIYDLRRHNIVLDESIIRKLIIIFIFIIISVISSEDNQDITTIDLEDMRTPIFPALMMLDNKTMSIERPYIPEGLSLSITNNDSADNKIVYGFEISPYWFFSRNANFTDYFEHKTKNLLKNLTLSVAVGDIVEYENSIDNKSISKLSTGIGVGCHTLLTNGDLDTLIDNNNSFYNEIENFYNDFTFLYELSLDFEKQLNIDYILREMNKNDIIKDDYCIDENSKVIYSLKDEIDLINLLHANLGRYNDLRIFLINYESELDKKIEELEKIEKEKIKNCGEYSNTLDSKKDNYEKIIAFMKLDIEILKTKYEIEELKGFINTLKLLKNTIKNIINTNADMIEKANKNRTGWIIDIAGGTLLRLPPDNDRKLNIWRYGLWLSPSYRINKKFDLISTIKFIQNIDDFNSSKLIDFGLSVRYKIGNKDKYDFDVSTAFITSINILEDNKEFEFPLTFSLDYNLENMIFINSTFGFLLSQQNDKDDNFIFKIGVGFGMKQPVLNF